MAILASAQWWVRAGGNALNGGGFDAAIAGAGTNYCDQDAAQLSLTDLATPGAGSTTLTSATGGFTAAMVGNCWRIPTGTNFVAGYYFATGYTDANTMTLDRSPTPAGAGSGGTGRLGGAFANVAASLSTGGTVTAPTITSPLAAGHQINLRGGGTDTPGSADYTQTGFASFPAGSTAAGRIRLVGYNGRPRIDSTAMVGHTLSHWWLENLMIKATGSGFASFGLLNSAANTGCRNIRVDAAGYDVLGILAEVVLSCEFVNTGGGASGGTYFAIEAGPNGVAAIGNSVTSWRGGGIKCATPIGGVITENVIASCGSHGISVSVTNNYSLVVSNNALSSNTGDGLRISSAVGVENSVAFNNIVDSSTAYGINLTAGSTAVNNRSKSLVDFNAFRANSSGAVNGISAGSNDITLSADPFTNAAGGDFTLNNTAGGGADLKNVAFPTSIP